MTRVYVRLRFATLLVICAGIPATLSGQDSAAPQQLWQSSWAQFLEALVPPEGLGENSDHEPSVKGKGFEGKQVTWEGVVDRLPELPTNTVRFQMEPRTAKVAGYGGPATVQLHVVSKPEAIEQWKQLPLGTKVRFRATLTSPLYVVVSFGSAPLLAIQGKDGEIVK